MATEDAGRRPAARVVDEIRRRIASGVLRPGDRVPSTRQIVRDFGVAMATASRALALLRAEGLITTTPGSGSVVRDARPRTPRASQPGARDLTRSRIVAAAIGLADREGLDAVSMRGLAGRLDVTPMSLYRYVAGRDELELLMICAAFRVEPLSDPGATEWRARLEEVYRLQWRLYRTHPWLTELLSATRPPLVPEAMAHSERTLETLARLGLPPTERRRAAMALPALVRGLALSAADELRAERETRMRTADWWTAMDNEIGRHVHSGRFPHLAAIGQVTDDHDELFEHFLGRYLDGLARLAGRT